MSTDPSRLDVAGGRFARRSRTYGGALALVLALLVAGVGVPLVVGDRPVDDTLASLPGSPDALLGTDGPLGGTAAAAPGPAAPGLGTTTPTAGPTAAGAPVGSPGAPGPVPGSAAGGSATTGPASAAPAAGSPARPAAGGAGPAAARPATGPPVKLGVVLTEIGALADAGFAGTEQYDTDRQREFWQAYVDHVNANGGAGGRRIVPVYTAVDIVGAQASAQAACKQLTETEKVFAVVHLLGIYGAPILCFTRDHRTPYLAVDGAVSSFYGASGGFLFTVQPSTLRTHLDSAKRLIDTGELGGARGGTAQRVGILSQDGYLQADNDALQRFLEQAGHRVTRGTHSSSSSQNVPAQLAVASSAMCNDGVEVVFLNTNALFAAQFANNIESRPGCRPAYVMSDFDFQMSGDSFLSQMPDGFFRRALSVTSSRVGEGRAGFPEPAYDAACRGVFERASGERLDRNATGSFTYFQAQWNCTLIDLFRRGMEAAGPGADRAGFARALGALGRFDNGGFATSGFRGGRTDGPEQVRIAQAFRDCTCWRAREAFGPPVR